MSGVEGNRGGFVGRRGGDRGGGRGGGDGGGVLRSEACETISGGGRAFGEMIMLGACVGSWGLRDQMAHFATGLGEAGWEDSGTVDMDPMCVYDEDVGGGVCRCGGGGAVASESGGSSWVVIGTEGGGS